MKKINWPLTVLFVWLFLFLFAAIVSHLEPRFCNMQMLEGISKQQDVLIFNCWEFWANRYQSLAGSLIAAGVAGLTLRALLRQLQANNRQAAVTSAQALRHRITEIIDERNAVCDEKLTIKYFLFDINFDNASEPINPNDIEHLNRIIPGTNRSVDAWYRIATNCLETVPPESRAGMYSAILKLTLIYYGEIDYLHATMDEYQRFQDNDQAVATASIAVADRLKQIHSIGRSIRNDVYRDLTATWQAVREFEKAAVR